MSDSQAGRRGFDPRLPLHLFNNLGSILELSLLRLLRFPSACRLPLPSTSSRFPKLLQTSAYLLVDKEVFHLANRCQFVLKLADGILILAHVHSVAHLSASSVRVNANLL